MAERMSLEALREVEAALEIYRRAEEASRLADQAQWIHLRHAETFVRWLQADFEPGERAIGRR